jgi:hypothetical protein
LKKHIWDEKGTFEIKCKAIDIHGNESDWGSLKVTMPKFKDHKLNYFNRLSEQFPNLFKLLSKLNWVLEKLFIPFLY